MGKFTDPSFWQQSPPPQTGDMNNERTLNQRATRELPGALPPQDVTIQDGAISGFASAALIVDTEGGATADELDVINIVLSANENLHPGMIITMRAKDPARAVTVKNSAAANGINTVDGNDIVLSPDWSLTLRLVGGRWYEERGRSSALADAAMSAAADALAAASAAQSTANTAKAVTDKVTPTPTANAVPQADANGKLDAYLTDRATVDLNNVTNNAIHFYFYARDEKPTGTSGGSTTGNAWQTRDINTVVHNNITGASLSSHRVSLPAGRYYIRATIPVYAGNLSRAALYNNTSSAYLLYGPSARADFTANVFMSQVVDGEITLTGPSAIELRMWVQTSYASGMGIATSTPGVPEIYSEIRIWKM